MEKGNKSETVSPRQKAEELLKKKPQKIVSQLSDVDMLKLIHELDVHQLELEIQKDELLLAKKQIETEIEKYADLYDFAPAGYFTLSREGKIIELNLSGAQLLGKERSILKNCNFSFFVSGDTRHIFDDFLKELFDSKTKRKRDVIISSNDSLSMHVHLSGIATANGEQCLVTAVDITEHKLAETALLSKTALLESQTNATIDGILVIDENQKRVFINRRIIELFDVPSHILDDEDDTLLLHYVVGLTKYPEKFLEKVLYLYEHQNETSRDEIEFRSGMVLDRYSAPVLGKDGKNYGRTWTFRDITDRKQAEEKLKTALLKAEASDKLKTAFINNISHEVRTPINGILGFGQFMLDPNLSQEEKELYFGILDKSTHRLISTITGIMDISLIVSGSMKVHKKTFYVKQLLDEIRRSYVKQCAEKNLPLCLDIPEENMEIHTDAGLLEKTLLHLLSNAVKFTHTGSITFGYTVGSNFLRFFVRDTGVGIKPEARNKIFGIFMQEDTSDTRGYEGCGLGLSIARGMVELLGGEIGFESVKGKGSTFFFTIPSPAAEIPSSVSEIPSSAAETPSPAAEIPSSVSEIPSSAAETPLPAAEIQPVILIVEDDETCYAYIKAILKNSSVELLSAVTGNEAVKKCLERTDISLILMDLKMPDMNGLEATKLIKSFRKNLPVIAVTAHAASGDEHKAISAGCDDYISKPYEKDLLIRKLGKYGIVIE